MHQARQRVISATIKLLAIGFIFFLLSFNQTKGSLERIAVQLNWEIEVVKRPIFLAWSLPPKAIFLHFSERIAVINPTQDKNVSAFIAILKSPVEAKWELHGRVSMALKNSLFFVFDQFCASAVKAPERLEYDLLNNARRLTVIGNADEKRKPVIIPIRFLNSERPCGEIRSQFSMTVVLGNFVSLAHRVRGTASVLDSLASKNYLLKEKKWCQ